LLMGLQIFEPSHDVKFFISNIAAARAILLNRSHCFSPRRMDNRLNDPVLIK